MVQINVELIKKIALYAVILNVVLPQVLKNFASEEEIRFCLVYKSNRSGWSFTYLMPVALPSAKASPIFWSM